jgi:pimeloyl-ACP methyl ester carboxylesterase
MRTGTILFIHGMFMTGRAWSGWADRFEAAGYRCLAPSWPGRDGDPTALRRKPPEALRRLTFSALVAMFANIARAQPRPPILIGHSIGGLVVQLLLARGLGARGVAISSAPPQDVRSLAFLPLLWPGATPINPSYERFKSLFWHTGSDREVRRFYDAHAVPESRLVGRGALGEDARVDFSARRGPLLMIAGSRDVMSPRGSNRGLAERYGASAAPTDFVLFSDRTHAICGQPGWEEVAARVRTWIEGDGRAVQSGVEALAATRHLDEQRRRLEPGTEALLERTHAP